MSPDLARKLIQKGVIHENTEIDAYYQGIDIGGATLARVQGNFAIKAAKVIGERLVFETVSTADGRPRRIECTDVLKIDGMEPERFAANFGMTTDGATVKQGKRRGRKPKASKEAVS